MVLVITASDRTAFKRCRRAWDFGSPLRQNLEPVDAAVTGDLRRAIAAALAVWYFPGMLEWDRAIVRPLAMEGYHRAVQGWPAGSDALAAAGEALLGRYFEWAQTVDLFTPVRVETEFQVPVPDPTDPLRDLVAADGSAVHFAGRAELLVIDELDLYWLVVHRVGPGWAEFDELLLDEEGVSTCWAWERAFLGMDVAGTIYNELRTDVDVDRLPAVPPMGTTAPVAVTGPGGPVRQAFTGPPSSEGGPVTGHRRMYVRAGREPVADITREGDGVFRRTRIRRGPVEMQRVRHKLGVEARDMTSERLAVYPAPAWDVCAPCPFRAPVHRPRHRRRHRRPDGRALPVATRPGVDQGRLGAVTWSIGRGAAPPTFGRGRPPAE